MTATLVQRHYFSITDVVGALLPDGHGDCERFEFRVNAGMLELDVVEQVYPQGTPEVTVTAILPDPVDYKSPPDKIDAFVSYLIDGPEPESPPWDESVQQEAASVQQPQPSVQPAPLKGGPIAKKAGILCADPDFWTFLKVRTEEAATNVLRRECGVSSRAELDHNQDAAEAFERLRGEFLIWERAI